MTQKEKRKYAMYRAVSEFLKDIEATMTGVNGFQETYELFRINVNVLEEVLGRRSTSVMVMKTVRPIFRNCLVRHVSALAAKLLACAETRISPEILDSLRTNWGVISKVNDRRLMELSIEIMLKSREWMPGVEPYGISVYDIEILDRLIMEFDSILPSIPAGYKRAPVPDGFTETVFKDTDRILITLDEMVRSLRMQDISLYKEYLTRRRVPPYPMAYPDAPEFSVAV